MNPDSNTEIPAVQGPTGQTKPTDPFAPGSGLESYALSAPQQGGGAPQGLSRPQVSPSLNAHLPSGPVPTTPPSASGHHAVTVTLPAIADDTDLIEKEWVVKAKEIVSRTHDDPYRQNEAMHRVKADYMKKRYNKDIKLSNG